MFDKKQEATQTDVSELPHWISKRDSTINRLIAFYSAIFKDRYGLKPTISNWGQTGKLLNQVLEDNSELMVASVMWVYFHLDDHYLEKNYYPINLLPRNFTKAQVKLKESLGEDFDDDRELKVWLKRNTAEILKSYIGNVTQKQS